jgi:F-type H+-transporting ATPase subunit b
MATHMSPLALRLAAEGEPSPLMPHLGELIVGLVAFALLFLFLRAKVFPMFEKVYAERHDAIEGGMARAKEAEEEAKATLAQYREQLAEARHEAARLREDAREQGAAIIVEMREQAQAEARRVTESAHQQIEADKQQAINQLRTTVGTLATDLASRIVGESLEDEARQSRVVERFLDGLEADVSGVGREPEPAGSATSGGSKGSSGGKGGTSDKGGTSGKAKG